jgi:hypothetical protein
MIRTPLLVLSAMLLSAGMGIATTAAGAARPVTGPRIVVTPNNAMVDSTVMLKGSGFAAHATLTIEECSVTQWYVLASPCVGTNNVVVVSGAHGGFSAPMTADLCDSGPWPGHPITERRCYVGEPKPNGVDTIGLVGAARLIVTYP